jgi:hypothetical protein
MKADCEEDPVPLTQRKRNATAKGKETTFLRGRVNERSADLIICHKKTRMFLILCPKNT